MMYSIKKEQFDKAYDIMEKAFPACELRPYERMRELFLQDDFVLYGMDHDGDLAGVILCWECDSCLFLENFAVEEALRGKGMGSEILSFIKERYKEQMVILEVEDPYDAISERRVAFYKRNEMQLSKYGYMQPPLREDVNTVPLLLMSYPTLLEEEKYKEIKSEVFAKVYGIKGE